jgi:hypothetical protein
VRTNSVAGDLNGPYLQRLCVDCEMSLTPRVAIFGSVLLVFSFAFAFDYQLDRLLSASRCSG